MQQLLWLYKVRAVVTVLIVLFIGVIGGLTKLLAFPWWGYLILFIEVVANFPYKRVLKLFSNWQTYAMVQQLVDFVVLTIAIHLLGFSDTRYLLWVYALMIFNGGLIIRRYQAGLMATLASVTVIQFEIINNFLPYWPGHEAIDRMNRCLPGLAITICFFYLTVYLVKFVIKLLEAEKSQLEKSTKDLTFFYEVSRYLGTYVEQSRVLNYIVSQFPVLINADFSAIFLVSDDGKTLSGVAGSAGIDETVRRLSFDMDKPLLIISSLKSRKTEIRNSFAESEIGEVCGESTEIIRMLNNRLCSCIMVPLIFSNEPIGMVVFCNEKEEFTREQVIHAEDLSYKASNAIVLARLYEKQNQTLREFSALNELAKMCLIDADVEMVLQDVINKIVNVTSSQSGILIALNEDKAIRHVKTSGLVFDKFTDEIRNRVIVEQIIKTGKSFIRNEVGRQMLVVPIRAAKEITGLFGVSRLGIFTSDEIKLMEIFADRVGLTIEKSLSTELTRKMANEFSMMAYVGNTILSTHELDDVLNLIVKVANQVMTTDLCSLRLLDENNELVRKASFGQPGRLTGPEKVHLGQGIVGRVLQSRQPIAVLNLASDERYIGKPGHADVAMESLLCVPLITHNRAIGVLTVYSAKKRNFSAQETNLLSTFASQTAVAIENARYLDETESMYLKIIRSFVSALHARDAYTKEHSEEAAKWAMEIGKAMELNEEQLEILYNAALLHDIGKIGVEDSILRKPGKLTPDEYEKVKKHPQIASEILSSLGHFDGVRPIILHHHEHYNGSGYPAGLQKDDIPLLARILLVIDSFEAMTSDRPYRKALGREKAIEELKNGSGKEFDPAVVDVFLKILEKN